MVSRGMELSRFLPILCNLEIWKVRLNPTDNMLVLCLFVCFLLSQLLFLKVGFKQKDIQLQGSTSPRACLSESVN